MPKGYIYAELEVTDPALFETYRPLAAASIAAFGGWCCGPWWRPGRFWKAVVRHRAGAVGIRQPGAGDGVVSSSQYQAALKIRLRSAKTKVVMLTGHSEG